MKTELVLIALFARSAFAACPDFAPAQTYDATGGNAYYVTVADVNNDGKPDLVTALFDANRINIRLNQGGTFETTGVNLTTDPVNAVTKPIYIAVGDFNRDGWPDLAVANYNTNNVGVRLGGAGGFSAPVTFAVGTTPTSIAVGDFNRDGFIDIVTTNQASNNVSVLLGNGAGSFATHVDYPAGGTPTAVAVGDFNRDGKLDLAIADFSDDKVALLTGNGTTATTFNTPSQIAAGTHPESIATGDVNRDGKIDLVVANYDYTNHTASILFGNGTSFLPGTAVPVQLLGSPNYTTLADVDHDGKLDLVTATYDANITWLHGKGNGTFDPTLNTIAAPGQSRWVAVGDFDHNGKSDLAIGTTTNLQVLENTGVCSVNCGSYPTRSFYAGDSPRGIVAADFNGDGKADLAFGRNPLLVGSNVGVQLGNGDGTFSESASLTASGADYLVAADFDRDGKLDLVVGTIYGEFYYFRGHGDGQFDAGAKTTVSGTVTMLIADDFDRDGNLDILTVSGYGSSGIYLLKGNGNGTFQSPTYLAMDDQTSWAVVGDFDRDGDPDVAVVNETSRDVTVRLNNGDGTFGDPTNYPAITNGNLHSLTAADLNQDGILDLVVGGTNGGYSVGIMLGVGDGTFGGPTNFSAAPTNPEAGSVTEVRAADVNDDGIIDIVAGNATYPHGTIGILIGNGNGTFAAPIFVPLGTYNNNITLGDFNRDGHLDIATASAPATFNSGSSIGLVFSCPTPDVTVTKTHAEEFFKGQTSATYTVTVTNSGFAPTTSGATVSMTDTLPSGLTLSATDPIGGSGWSCLTAPTITCSRSDTLSGRTDYPPITVHVDVSPTANATVTNHAVVTGGGEIEDLNNSADDLTIVRLPSSTSLSADVSSSKLGAPVTLTATVTSGATGDVSFYEDGTNLLGTATISSDVAQLTTTMMHLGSHTITATYQGDATYGPSTSSGVPHTVTGAPATNLVALTASTTSTSLTWTGDAASYDVYRRDSDGGYALITTTSATSLVDGTGALSPLNPNTTYRYRIVVVDTNSNEDFATTVVFTDDPVTARSTGVKADHVNQLIATVNAMRAAVALSPFAFAGLVPAQGGPIATATDMTGLRDAINDTLGYFGRGNVTYDDPSFVQVKASHINNMRDALR